jgi:hypothetical protein
MRMLGLSSLRMEAVRKWEAALCEDAIRLRSETVQLLERFSQFYVFTQMGLQYIDPICFASDEYAISKYI